MSAAVAGGLTREQIETFRREGWLILEGLFSPAELQPLAGEISAVVDEHARRLHAEGKLPEPYEDEGFLTRLTRITQHTDEAYYALAGGRHCGREMFEILRHPRMLDVAESLLGPEIVGASAYRIRPKVPNHPHGVVPWHQDSGYFEPACDGQLILVAWIPLVDATRDNGCLWVIPRGDVDSVLTHHRRPMYLAVADELLDLDRAVCVEMSAGSALLLDNLTPHSSQENATDVVRWSIDLRYQGAAAPSPVLPEPFRSAALEATRQDDQFTPACYAPEADFLVRSRAHPELVVSTWEEFERLRSTHTPGAAPNRWPA